MSPRHPLHVSVLLAVAVGGALGAAARHAVSHAEPEGAGFPWATLAVNVSGSFLLALLPAARVVVRHRLLPPLLGTGVLGGFTTLSAYSEQTRALVESGAVAAAAAYAIGSVLACLAAVAVARHFTAPPSRARFDEEEGDL